MEKESIRLPPKASRTDTLYKSKNSERSSDLVTVLSGLPVVRKAVPAVDRSVGIRFERNLSFSATVGTYCIVHFPRASETSPVVVSSPEGISVIKSHFLFTSAYNG